jgi:hypothetical protein
MSTPAKINYKICQGSTFIQTLRWESSTKVYVPITGISKSAPVVITAPAHNIAVGWRTRITNVGGMREINSDTEYYTVTGVDTNTITLNQINSLDYTAYTSGGVLEYNQPVDLGGYSARMQIREKLTSDSTIYELSTQNGGIVLDNTTKTIGLRIPSSVTEGFNFTQAVYGLEIYNANIVICLANGNLTLTREVTR